MTGGRPEGAPAPGDRPAGPSRERLSEWAAAIARGDESAFESLFLACYDRLQLFAERFVQRPELAEELVATVFTRIWQHRDRLSIQRNLRSYLYASVRNEALMHLQRQHGLSYREIAEVMGIHRKTVEIHLGRALKALRHELSAFLPESG